MQEKINYAKGEAEALLTKAEGWFYYKNSKFFLICI